jgi:hypothetical protein
MVFPGSPSTAMIDPPAAYHVPFLPMIGGMLGIVGSAPSLSSQACSVPTRWNGVPKKSVSGITSG